MKSCPILLLALLAATLMGCSSPDLIVVDINGTPIPGAKIVGTSLSVSGQSTVSDTKGQAKIPWSVQDTKWISVHKDGFKAIENIDATQKKPIVVRMAKANG